MVAREWRAKLNIVKLSIGFRWRKPLAPHDLEHPLSPRVSQFTDGDILILATRAVRRHGPRVTLAQIGDEVGLTPARLVQRFGSRQELLAAVEASVDERLLRTFIAGLGGHESPLEGMVESLAALGERNAKRLYLLSRSYVFDPGHLASPDGAGKAADRVSAFEAELRRVLERAVADGELPEGDIGDLARAVFVTWIGSYNLWAYAPVGPVGDAIRRDLGFLLAREVRSEQ